MKRNSGMILQLEDGRYGILYSNDQPLLKDKGMYVIKLVTNNVKLEPVLNDKKEQMVLLRKDTRFDQELKDKTINIIGYVD